MKSLAVGLMLAMAACSAVPLFAADEKSKPAKSEQSDSAHAFVGVAVESLHPGMGRHFRDMLSGEQGLIVEDVAENSPASKAGFKDGDILTKFDDQKLFSAEQFAKLVHCDKAGRAVTISFIRDGKPETAQLTLGTITDSELEQRMSRDNEFESPMFSMRHPSGDHHPSDSGAEWATFDSMSLKKMQDGKFHAEVQYMDKDGKMRKHTFEGNREELEKDINTQKDMKPVERAQLLRALGFDEGPGEFGAFPSVWFHRHDQQPAQHHEKEHSTGKKL